MSLKVGHVLRMRTAQVYESAFNEPSQVAGA